MLSINISEVIWTVINFFLLYFLLKKFLFNPIVEHMDKRNEKVKQGFDAEKEALDALAKHDEELSARMDESRAEARRLIAAGKQADDAERAQALKAARADAAAERQNLRDKAIENDAASRRAIENSREKLAAALGARLMGR